MVRVVIDGEIVEKTEEEILEMDLSFDGRRTKHKQLLSETAKLILAALLERPLTRFGIAKRLGARTDDLSDYLYYKTRSPSCLSRAILLKLGLVQRHGKKWTSTFCVNPDKLDEVKKHVDDIELPDPVEAAARFEKSNTLNHLF
jgi:hypothetical protein